MENFLAEKKGKYLPTLKGYLIKEAANSSYFFLH